MRRVVVTGMGAVSPLGCGVERIWGRLLAGRSGLARLPDEHVGGLPCKVGGGVPDGDADPEGGLRLDEVVPPKEQRRMDRFIMFAIAAAEEAVAQAGWAPESEVGRQRTATIVASGTGGVLTLTNAVRQCDRSGSYRLSPFSIPSYLGNMAAGHVSIRHGFKGPIGAPMTACAASVQAIGDGTRLIRAGEADVAVCGGAEAALNDVSLAGFAAARTLSTRWTDTPTAASRPFDVDRDGFVMSEGSAILVIEALDHALARGARPIAEIVGYGTTADAHHITAGCEDGAGARRAMELALEQAGVAPSEVAHLNAHATSTPVGDVVELEAIKSLFGRSGGIAVSATKSATGHMLGATGAMEAIFTVLALRDQTAPPTLNLDNPDPAAEGVDIVAHTARPMAMDHAISNGFGFGGVNASLLFRRW